MQVSKLEWIEHKSLHYIDKRRTARIGCDNEELIRSIFPPQLCLLVDRKANANVRMGY